MTTPDFPEMDSSHKPGREIWILRTEERQRAALVRLAGVTGPLVQAGSPRDARFGSGFGLDAAGGARNVGLIVLGVSGDPEIELEYVHRNARHFASAHWILVSDDRSDAELAALFDALDATFIGPPVQAARLRGAIARALEAPQARDSLRLRRYRDALSERFARWFGDLDLPELLRAMDPQLARVPMVIRGEPGTGRALLARYVHTFGGDAAGGQMPFVEIVCTDETSRAELHRGIETSAAARHATLFLKDLEELAPQVQAQLRNWIEFGLPPGTRCASNIRWVGALSAGDAPLADSNLLAVLSGLEVRLPPLRSRRSAIEAFARATALAHRGSTGRRARDFSPGAIAALQHHDWPGNLRELESVIRRALADSGADPLEARHLKIPNSRRAEPLAEIWQASGDDTRAEPFETLIELRASDLLDDLEVQVGWSEDEDDGSDNASGLSTEWIEAEPIGSSESLAEIELLSIDHLDGLPSIEVRPLPRGDAARAAIAKGAQASAPPNAPNVSQPVTASDANSVFWQRALSLITEEVQRPVESMRSLAETFAAHGVPPSYAQAFAFEVSHNIVRACEVSARLDAIVPSPEISTDASNLLESVLAELRHSISQRGLLVLKELDRARPVARVPASALRFAVRSLLARFVARDRTGSSSDLYIASHHNPAGLRGAPSMRILLRHAFAAGQAPSPETTEREFGIELALCDAVARSSGGSLSLSEPDAGQIVVVIDLPAPD